LLISNRLFSLAFRVVDLFIFTPGRVAAPKKSKRKI
jgi:hypothetical protein